VMAALRKSKTDAFDAIEAKLDEAKAAIDEMWHDPSSTKVVLAPERYSRISPLYADGVTCENFGNAGYIDRVTWVDAHYEAD
jgi:hypothetical protein